MWKFRNSTDYFDSVRVNETKAECISKKTIREFLDRLALAETWLLKHLLGENYAVRAGAVNVKVTARKDNGKSDTYFGDLYVVQNLKDKTVSFKLYSPKENQFVWSAETTPSLKGYVDLTCNTHILYLGDVVYCFKFPNKKERSFFRENINKFFEKSKKLRYRRHSFFRMKFDVQHEAEDLVHISDVCSQSDRYVSEGAGRIGDCDCISVLLLIISFICSIQFKI